MDKKLTFTDREGMCLFWEINIFKYFKLSKTIGVLKSDVEEIHYK